MNKSDSGTTTQPWEYLVYVVVTIPLLLVGVVLWLGSMGARFIALFRKRGGGV